jgi:hypothetical protein
VLPGEAAASGNPEVGRLCWASLAQGVKGANAERCRALGGGHGDRDACRCRRLWPTGAHVSETAALGSISAGGLRLTGPGLDVELYVIGDKKDIQRILAAARLMAADQRSAGVAVPAKAYARGDLFVLVRAEPVEGGVGEALERISTE